MIILNNYNDIYEIAKSNKEFTVDLSNLNIKHRLRVIDFLSGLSFNNGKLEKINANTYKCSYK